MQDWLEHNVCRGYHNYEPYHMIKDKEDLQSSLHAFLEKRKPSDLERYDSPWIWILNDRLVPAMKYDYDSLTLDWKNLCAKAGNRIEHDDIADIAKKYNFLSGKWKFRVRDPSEVDVAWSLVAKEFVEGQLGTVSMAASVHKSKVSKLGESHEFVICVYNEDYTDKNQVDFAMECLRNAGIKQHLKYKLDIYAHLGITRHNTYQLKTTIYGNYYVAPEQEFPASGRTLPKKKTAEELAAESMAVKFLETVVYTVGSDNSGLSVEEWINKFPPSLVFTKPEFGSIEIINDRLSSHKDDEELRYQNLIQMQKYWEKMVSSNENVDFQKICDIANKYNVKGGKWLFYVNSDELLADIFWKFVVTGIARGELGDVALNANICWTRGDNRFVIKVHNDNFMDKDQVVELEKKLRCAGVKCKIMYKPDIYSKLGIYARNTWGLRPTIYESLYDAMLRSSKIVNNSDPSGI